MILSGKLVSLRQTHKGKPGGKQSYKDWTEGVEALVKLRKGVEGELTILATGEVIARRTVTQSSPAPLFGEPDTSFIHVYEVMPEASKIASPLMVRTLKRLDPLRKQHGGGYTLKTGAS